MNHSKFIVPQTQNVLVRERLLGKIAACSDKKLVILHAQAGQGKSTLAASFAATLPEPIVWYSFDAGDDGPEVFLSSLGRALQSSLPDRFPDIPCPLRSRYGLRAEDPAVTSWIDRVFGATTFPCLIVLDDYHLVNTSPAFRSVLKSLFETTPPSVRFLLLSRTRPELEIARLRARQGVAELTGEDLTFSDDEAQELFCAVFGMPIAPAEASAINRTAEGWPAGLVLLHGYLSAAPGEDRRATLNRIERPEVRAHVFEYLAQEVFVNLPDRLQDFLLRTAVADVLPAPLLAALTGLPETASASRASVASVVQELIQRNLFVTAVGTGGTTIRYHALFRDFLQATARERCPASIRKRRSAAAAAFFKSAGDPVRAIDLLLAEGNSARAIREIESCGQELVAQGRARTVLRWIDSLPEIAADRPWFQFLRAVACRYSEPRTALALYERAYRRFLKDRDRAGQMLSLSGIIEACFHAGGDFARMGRTALRAEALLHDGGRGSSEARARLLLAVGMAWFFTGRLQQGADALLQALDLFRRQKNPFSQVTAAIYLAPCALYQGDFTLAREAILKGFAASDTVTEETGGRSALFLTQAMTALFEGNFSDAEKSIEQCRKLAADHALESIGFLSLDIGGWLKIAQGDLAGAVRLLEECGRNSDKASHPFFYASSSHLLAIARLFQGKLKHAKEASDRALAVQRGAGSRLFQGIYLIAGGAIQLKQGLPGPAEKDLLAALRMLQQCGAAQQEANAHLLLASLNLSRKREKAARGHLAAGFGIGAERGFTYYALLRQDELAVLATEAVNRGIERRYCQQLIAGRPAHPAEPAVRIFCLGEFRILRDGIPISDGEWKSRLAKILVKLLAARGSRKLSRDEAAETLWPDVAPSQHSQLLNSLLHRTRKVLAPARTDSRGGSCILQEGGMLSLNPRMVWVDIDEFSHLHALSRQQLIKRTQDAGGTLALYDRAFGLYQGDFLPGDLYHDWSGGLRDHLKTMHHDMLMHAANLTDAAGTRDAAAAYYEKMFRLDPCNEKACRWLMSNCIASGRRIEAIRLYERCQLALRKDLEIEPDDQTRRLYRNIIGG